MNEIIIGFSRPKAWLEPFSWLIRLITWSSFSHAYIRFYDTEYNRWLIFQASGAKVNFIGMTMFDGLENIYEEFNVPISDLTKKVVVQSAIDICGSPYGVGQIIGFGWVLLARLFGKKVKNPFASNSSFVCSELVAEILIEIDKEDSGTLDPSTMSPQDLYNFMIEKGYQPVKSVSA
jgi:hypothetical protein